MKTFNKTTKRLSQLIKACKPSRKDLRVINSLNEINILMSW